jgi:hypothetical protein
MKHGFLVIDKQGNDYRVLSKNITLAINKVITEHDLNEDDIVKATASSQGLSSLSL